MPTSTYRVQLHAGFDFRAAAAVVPYLADLGVGHLYCSPYLQAAPGSTHGYDVVDHGRLNAELGGEEGFAELSAAVRGAGMGIVLDVVPNHSAVSEPESQNAAWWDVLKQGPSSAYAGWFDIAWDSPDNPGRVLVPVLGSSVGECIAAGEIVYSEGPDGPLLRYYDHVVPVAPGTEKLAEDLPALLEAQHFRLCQWRVAADELNYRRFFDVTTLAGVRVEDPEVFEATHRLLLDQLRAGILDGLRIDHPDGLADPGGYLARLAEATGGCWVVVEKILEAGEELPPEWACAGTTGYDALNRLLGIFVDPAGEAALTTLYGELTRAPTSYPAVVETTKHLVLDSVLVAEVNRLTDVLVEVARADPRTRDFTRRGLRRALVEVLAAFDVYRAYVTPGQEPSSLACGHVEAAADIARRVVPSHSAEVDLVRDLALGRGLAEAAGERRPTWSEFVTRFQQTCGPVMAKGVEDTAFYRYHRLDALNEVGGDPGRFGISPSEFHAAAAATQRDWPVSMTTLSTHDTKRSEDVRARLALLSEIPQRWGDAVVAWTAHNERYRAGGPLDRNTEYLLYQTLVGAWPLSPDRALAYLEKASREAKAYTTWTDPDPAYDEALAGFVTSVLDDPGFVEKLEVFVADLVRPARVGSLAQKLVQLTMPGVPDVYQGSELWDLSLVDPDNRRPVDYDRRRRLLRSLDTLGPADVLAQAGTGLPKLLVVSRALRLRREHPDWFGAAAGYQPLPVSGAQADRVLAFARGTTVATVVPRLVMGLERSGWGDTTIELAAGRWRDELTGATLEGGQVRPQDLFADFPVSLLVRQEATRR
ncbi:MAG: malto-oligosyltrehalose synthase [Actinomycetota bacterium]|nr:malto-oligosyltrehalose synthase [Actinomycetota bacterium]